MIQDKLFNRPCLAHLIDFVATDMDKQMHTGMILEDLQKTFDTLNHGVLLEKMKYFGFRASASGRFQRLYWYRG